MVLRNDRRQRVIVVIGQPIYDAVRLVFPAIYKALFWWVDIWLQRRRNAALRDEIQANLFFLYSAGTVISEKWIRTAIHPFDYAVVGVISDKLHFSFARGQDQLNILLAPQHLPNDTHDLYTVLAAFDGVDIGELKPTKYLSDVAELLRPRIDALNDAFSETGYSSFRQKLSEVDADLDVVRRQSEWQLNKAFYSSR